MLYNIYTEELVEVSITISHMSVELKIVVFYLKYNIPFLVLVFERSSFNFLALQLIDESFRWIIQKQFFFTSYNLKCFH